MARENIEALLGLTLPVSSATATDEVTVECGVCYTYKLPKGVGEPGEFLTPDFRCEADACGRAFHTSCLVEWLTAIPTTRKSFGMLFGQCPYCQQTINITC